MGSNGHQSWGLTHPQDQRSLLVMANTNSSGTEKATLKRCARCGKHKPTTDFYSNRAMADGLNKACIPCITEYMKERRAQQKAEGAPKSASPSRFRSRQYQNVVAPTATPPPATASTSNRVDLNRYSEALVQVAHLLISKGMTYDTAVEASRDIIQRLAADQLLK